MIQKLLTDVVLDHENTFKLYALAKEYDKLEQGAGAVTFYMRAAENNKEETFEERFVQYKALIKMALIYHREGNRDITARGLFQHAIVQMPERPEAYFIYSDWLANRHDWRDSLVISKQGLSCTDFKKVDDDLDYIDKWQLEFIYAISKWKTEGSDRSKNLLFDFKYKTNHNKHYGKLIDTWIKQAGYPSTLQFTSEDIESYKFPFNGIEYVKKNYSRHYQDMFVLSALDGKNAGTFIEIGSGDPYVFNNTALLEETFGWTGLSIDINERFAYQFSRKRNTQILNADASQLDYELLFKMNCVERHTDFLRINAETATYAALQKIPFHKHEFFVIQVQHNACWWGNELRERTREILQDIGYVLAVPDVAVNETDNYEDWWLHPEIAKVKRNMISKGTNFAYRYMNK
jgi:heme-degrading monooxygenase HmoA